MDVEAAAAERREDGAAGLSQDDQGLGIHAVEERFERGHLRTVGRDQRRDLIG